MFRCSGVTVFRRSAVPGFTTENVDFECAAFELVNVRSGKNFLGWICWTVKTFCCVVMEIYTDLVFFGLSGSTSLTTQDCSHLRCRFRVLNGSCRDFFKYSWPLSCATKFAWTPALRSRPTLVFLLCVTAFGCSKSVFEQLANFIFSERSVSTYHTLRFGSRRWFMARYKRASIWF